MNTESLKTKLLAEKKKIEGELSDVGNKNPANPADWEPKAEEMDVSPADPNEVADAIEDLEARSSITEKLELRLGDVNLALKKIDENDYGKCEKCNAPIEERRLEADPAARTCIAHREVKL